MFSAVSTFNLFYFFLPRGNCVIVVFVCLFYPKTFRLVNLLLCVFFISNFLKLFENTSPALKKFIIFSRKRKSCKSNIHWKLRWSEPLLLLRQHMTRQNIAKKYVLENDVLNKSQIHLHARACITCFFNEKNKTTSVGIIFIFFYWFWISRTKLFFHRFHRSSRKIHWKKIKKNYARCTLWCQKIFSLPSHFFHVLFFLLISRYIFL